MAPESTGRRLDNERAQLYTPDEAALLLRCKASWLKEQARLRRIPFTFVAGAYRFTIDHLLQIIDDNEQPPAPDELAQPSRTARPVQQEELASPLKARRPRRPRDST